MTNVIHTFQLVAIALAGWLNRHQQAVAEELEKFNGVAAAVGYPLVEVLGESADLYRRQRGTPASESKQMDAL